MPPLKGRLLYYSPMLKPAPVDIPVAVGVGAQAVVVPVLPLTLVHGATRVDLPALAMSMAITPSALRVGHSKFFLSLKKSDVRSPHFFAQ